MTTMRTTMRTTMNTIRVLLMFELYGKLKFMPDKDGQPWYSWLDYEPTNNELDIIRALKNTTTKQPVLKATAKGHIGITEYGRKLLNEYRLPVFLYDSISTALVEMNTLDVNYEVHECDPPEPIDTVRSV